MHAIMQSKWKMEGENWPLIGDLKVGIQSWAKLRPSEASEKKTMFLSNIDQPYNFCFEVVHFFAGNPDYPPEKVAELLRTAVERLLVPYYFLAGRLRAEGSEGRLEIDCNSAGVDFIVAKSELRLHEIGDVEFPNPAFRQLVGSGRSDQVPVMIGDQQLCDFQVTFFKCGSFALGISYNHVIFDGTGIKTFLINLAAIAGGSSDLPAGNPSTDRQLLSPRSPPRVSPTHHELILRLNPSSFSSTPFDLLTRSSPSSPLTIFRLSSSAVSSLKRISLPFDPRPTTFKVVAAHLWRCKSLAKAEKESSGLARILCAVDIRNSISPALPESFMGNATLVAYGEEAAEVVRRGEFGRVVNAVTRAVEKVGEEDYVRSMIDWIALYRKYPKGDMVASSWLNIGLSEVAFPWGKAVYSAMVSCPARDLMVLLPSAVVGRVNVLATLPQEEVEMFERLFYGLLPGHTIRQRM